MLVANAKQKLDKELKLAEQAKFDQEEFTQMTEKQLISREYEKKKDEEKRKMLGDHNQQLKFVIL